MKFLQCRKEKGFTLVEVIVVAVIVAVLAAVAIPLYMGYIKDSRIDVGNNVGGTISGACGASTQQKVDFTAMEGDHVSPDAPAAPVSVTFSSVSLPVTNNTIIIPNGYTATITGSALATAVGTVVCYYTDYGAASAKTYTFKQ